MTSNVSLLPTKRVVILGVPIDDVTEDETIRKIADWIAGGVPRQICTVNPEFVMAAQRHPAFRRVLRSTALNTPDGTGLLVVARMRGEQLRQRVTGVALAERLAAESAAHGWKLFFLGAAPGVAEQAAEVLAKRYPGVQVVGCYAGSPRPEDEADIRERVLAVRPDVLLVAYGHPAQDLWIARNQLLLDVPIAIGVGGTFDEIAGLVAPAPEWIHRIGLKWLYRLARQPWRWRRILTAVPLFLFAALREQWQG